MARHKKRKLRSGEAFNKLSRSLVKPAEHRFKKAISRALREKLGGASKSRGSSDHRS